MDRRDFPSFSDASQARRWSTRPDDMSEERDHPPRRFEGRGGSPPPSFRGGHMGMSRGRGRGPPPRHAPSFLSPQAATHTLPSWLRDARLEPGVLVLFESLYHRGLLSTQDLAPAVLDELERMHPSLAIMAIEEFSSLDHYRIRDLTSCFIDICARNVPSYPPPGINGRSPPHEPPSRDLGYRPPSFSGGRGGGLPLSRAPSLSNVNNNDGPNLPRAYSTERLGAYRSGPGVGVRGQMGQTPPSSRQLPPSEPLRTQPSDAQAQISIPVHRQEHSHTSNSGMNVAPASGQSRGQAQGQVAPEQLPMAAQVVEKSCFVADPESFEGPSQIIDALLGSGPSLDGYSSMMKKRRRAEAEALLLSGGGDIESHTRGIASSETKQDPRVDLNSADLVDPLSRPEHGTTLVDLREMRLMMDCELGEGGEGGEVGSSMKGASSLMEDDAVNVLNVIKEMARSVCGHQTSMIPLVVKRAMMHVSMSLSGLEGTGYLSVPGRIEVIQKLVEDGFEVLQSQQQVLAV